MSILRVLLWGLLWQGAYGFLSSILAKGRRLVQERFSSLALLSGDRRRFALTSSVTKDQDETKQGTPTKEETLDNDDGRQSTPEISPYYRRDRHDNSTTPLPPTEVLRNSLEARWQARQDKDTDRIRTIDGQLRSDHGIYVYDQPPIWTRQKEPPSAYLRKRAELHHNKRKEKYGPRGHPFQRVGEMHALDDPLVCLFSEPLVHEMLGHWTDCTMKNNGNEQHQERAGAILFELSLHGIRVNTSCLQWTTDQNYVFGEPEQVMLAGCSNYNASAYREDTDLSKLGTFLEEDRKTRQRIEHLVQRRTEAQMTGRKRENHFIGWELKQCYGVHLNDWNKSWFVDSQAVKSGDSDTFDAFLSDLYATSEQSSIVNMLPGLLFSHDSSVWNSPGYKQSDASLEQSPAIASRIRDLVQERIHKREESKYVEADAIRRELWHTYVRLKNCLCVRGFCCCVY